MGAIKDIVDICLTLNESSKDAKVTEAVRCIQSLTLALQSEQSTLLEKNAELLTENLNLKRKLFEVEVAQMQKGAPLQKISPAPSQTHEFTRQKSPEQAALAESNATLCNENLNLKRKLAEMEAASREKAAPTSGPAPKPEDLLERQTAEVLKLFFNSANDLSSLQVALALKLSPSVAERHLDELLKRRFIGQSSTGDKSAGYARYGLFRIRPEGRAYITANALEA